MRVGPGLLKLLAFLIFAVATNGSANPFDPSGYLQKNEVEKGELTLISTEIYQINRKRFLKFVGSQGSVVFPSPMEEPDIQENLALCGYHLRAFDEVLMIRKGLPVPKLDPKENKIVMSILHKCLEGKLKGPSKTIETHDGVSVTIEPTKGDDIKTNNATIKASTSKDNSTESESPQRQK